MAKVVMIESFLKQYRVPFFEGLVEYLRPRGVDLKIVFGQPDRFHERDSDIVEELAGATKIRNRYFYFGRASLAWQPVWKHVQGADLVIVHQGNRHITNHLLLLLRRTLGFDLAFFGHGRNFQHPRPDCLAERIKRFYSRRSDYWFAYNDRSMGVLRGMGFSEDRITSVQNALDARKLIAAYESVSPAEASATRAELGISREGIVGVYCGRFYRDKEMDFTLSCAEQVHLRDERFHFLLIGDGAEAQKVIDFCQARAPWAHYVGPRYGREKAKYFKIAQCQLMPGAVGLSIVDSFAFLTPLITRDIPQHGPEIDYLDNGRNGLMTPNTAQAYVDAVVGFLRDSGFRSLLIEGCLQARNKYTIENMIQRFGDGICRALERGGSLERISGDTGAQRRNAGGEGKENPEVSKENVGV